jgi:hypothetical protein
MAKNNLWKVGTAISGFIIVAAGCAQQVPIGKPIDTPSVRNSSQPTASKAEPSTHSPAPRGSKNNSPGTTLTIRQTTKRGNTATLNSSQNAAEGQTTSPSASNNLTESKIPDIVIARPFKLKFGHKRSLPDSDVNFKLSTINDNRCPLETQCVQAGDAKVTLTIYRAHERINTVILDGHNTEAPSIKDREVVYVFHLMDLQPYPTVQFVSPEHYVAEIMITKTISQ